MSGRGELRRVFTDVKHQLSSREPNLIDIPQTIVEMKCLHCLRREVAVNQFRVDIGETFETITIARGLHIRFKLIPLH
jgi:hypothetical protein